ncbi:MAG: 50S ribosomal protein L18 [Lachnospiraceae bacterium]|jgi:large subunit ribosomal protein L18|nr:50S ribosomal protein L18 [Lachnospiraceae bacterium]
MITKECRKDVREKKHLKTRNRFSGTAERPRLSFYRSNKHIYAQIIDDVKQQTLVAASTVEKDISSGLKNTDDVEAAAKIGEIIAKRAADKGITKVVFDRGGFIYLGKVAALAEAARKGGLEF